MNSPRFGFEDQDTLDESDRRLRANRDEALNRKDPTPAPEQPVEETKRGSRRSFSLRGLTYERLRGHAKAQGTPMSRMVERWIDEALDDG